MEEMTPMIPLTNAETQYEKRINNLIHAYNNAEHEGMRYMWRDKVLELTKNMVNGS
jgi:hypothetical protein|tara:strand:- start:3484 stop:3651 length:168 start_codon:yes stop_codon:yes gene_type:complete